MADENLPYTGYQEIDYDLLKRRFKSESWKLKFQLLIADPNFNEKYSNAKKLEAITFLTYETNSGSDNTILLLGSELILIQRKRFDKLGKEYFINIYIRAMIGNFKSDDQYIIGDNKYRIKNIYTLRKKDWEEIL